MKSVKKWVLMLVLCVSMVFTFSAVQASASNTVEVGYWAEPSVTIDKGDPVQTGDTTDLYPYFVVLSLSTFSLFFVLVLWRKQEREENKERKED